MFPIFSVSGNQLVSLEGETSSLYQLIAPDLEQMEEVENVFLELSRVLADHDNEWVKLYCIDGRFWINSKKKPEFASCEVQPEENPFCLFFNDLDSDIEFYEDYFLYNGIFHRIFSVKEFFPVVEHQYLSKLNFCICLRSLGQHEAKGRLNMKRRLHFSSLFKGMKDVEGESAFAESEDLLERVVAGDEALVVAEMFFIQKSASKKELDGKKDELISYVKSLDGKVFIEARGLQYFFKSIMPGVRPSFKRAQLCPSSYIAELIPFHRDSLMDKGVSFESRNQKELYFDLFYRSAANFNTLITGTSGQGKSMLANKLVKESFKNGDSGMILDLGNSFRKNVLFHGGAIFSEKINPLQFPNPVFLKEFMKALMDEKLSRKEEGKLLEAIKEIDLLDKDIFSFIKALEESFPEFRFYFSEYLEFLTTEKRPLAKLSYCDLGNYPDSFKSALILYLLEYFKNLDGRKVFVFDECWGLLKNNADYVAECFRTFRKHEASAIAISQNLDDFSQSQLGKVIIQNTYFKFLFRQNLEESQFLTPFQKDQLKTVYSEKGSYSEFLLLSEEHQKVCRYKCDPLEYELFNTSRQDSSNLELYMEEQGKYLAFREAMINFTKIKNPRWIYEG